MTTKYACTCHVQYALLLLVGGCVFRTMLKHYVYFSDYLCIAFKTLLNVGIPLLKICEEKGFTYTIANWLTEYSCESEHVQAN